jgi:hypothetical protein
MANDIKTKILLIAALLPTAMAGYAQSDMMNRNAYQWLEEQQLWRSTNNAAGLSLDTMANYGVSRFHLSHSGGNYARVQDGDMENKLTFFSERYQKISEGLYGYGKFQFDMSRTKGRAWSDVLRSHNSNPYFSGSAIKGRYDLQDFDLTAAISTTKLGHISLGGRLDYKVADFSRLRDPRSRINMLDYKVTPSVTYSPDNSNSVGLAGWYHRRKEKLPNFANAQSNANIPYYYFSGMENMTVQGGNSYLYAQREWVNHEFGAELSYGYRGDNAHSLTSLYISRGAENVYWDAKAEVGKYFSYKYGLNTQNRFRIGTGKLLSVNFKAQYEQAYSDEYRQEKVTTIDAQGFTSTTYKTLMTYKKRYRVNVLDIDFNSRLSFVGDNGVNSYVGLGYQLGNVRNKYVLNTSELKYIDMKIGAEGGVALLRNHLWVDGRLKYKFNTDNTLNLYDNTTAYAQNVLIPDMRYLGANYVDGGLSVTYQFPLDIHGYKANWYVKLSGDYLRSNTHEHFNTIGLTFGLFN